MTKDLSTKSHQSESRKTYMNQKNSTLIMKSFSIVLQIAGYLLIAVSLISLYFTFTDSWNSVVQNFPSLFHRGEIKSATKQLGSFAEYAVIATAGFWLCKTLLGQIKNKKIQFSNIWNKRISTLLHKAFLFFKKHHMFLGWVTVILASGHGVYFLLFPDNKIKYFYTGLAALIGLVIVAGVGIVFDQFMKKNKAVKAGRRYHFAAAVLFAVLFLVHLYV
jgi:hypothetical protein